MDLIAHKDRLRARLLASRVHRMDLANASGGVISYSWLSKFANGWRDNPTITTLTALERVLDELE